MQDGPAVEVFAPAKLNLTLHVTGQRADGYHLLDSLVVFADLGDRVTVAPGAGRFEVTGPFAAGVPVGADNLVARARDLILPRGGVDIRLEKTLPPASGIGGGSSDAAATLLACARVGGVDLPPAEAVLGLGADVPVCLQGQPVRMSGIGEQIAPVPGLPGLELLLVNPGFELPTGRIFSALRSKTNPPMPADLPRFRSARDFCTWLRDQRNDLERAALSVEPRLSDVFEILTEYPNFLMRMSGSGATCYAVFENHLAEVVEQDISKRRPGWWVRSASTWSPDRA